MVIYTYANNHFAGHRAGDRRAVYETWNANGFPQITRPPASGQERTLLPIDESATSLNESLRFTSRSVVMMETLGSRRKALARFCGWTLICNLR